MSQARQGAADERDSLTRLVEQVAERAIRAGAHAAEVVAGSGSRLHVKVREGKPELVQEAQSKSLGLRVLRERCAALTYTSDFSESGLQSFVDNAVALCRLSEPDPDNELPAREELLPKDAKLPDLGLWDDRTPTLDAAFALAEAKACEAAALAFSPKLRPDSGASFSRHSGCSAIACADESGVLFAGSNRGTTQYLAVSVLCDDRDGKKRRGSYYTSDRFVKNLLSPEQVGRTAGERALARVGAEKIDTCELPIIFDAEEAQSIVGLLAQLVSAGAIYRKQSYLAEHEGEIIASPLVTVVDDPLIQGAVGSRPFDGEGLAARRNVVVEKGRLLTFLYDTYSARRLGRKSNGCAGRSGAGSVHVATSNFILEPGDQPEEALYRDLPRALYVTEMMGFGFNPITGDFSRGAGGFLVENGKLTRPVSEVTISANFDDLLKRIDAVGNNVDRRGSVITPSLRVSRMTVAGR